MDETWLYHYDPETKQQSVEWKHSGSPRPKKFRVQKSAGKFLASIFRVKTASSSLIIFQRAELSNAEYYSSLLMQLKDFCRKNAAGRSPRGFCSCTTMPRLTGHLQPRRNWPTWASSVLITHPILRIWPLWTATSSLDWKKQLKSRHFSSDSEVIVGRANFWMFLSDLQKLQQRAKKCIELHGEYVE